MVFLLERQGHQILECAGIQDGHALLSRRPDVLLLDLMLPDGSGLDLLQRIRSEQLAIRVAVITGASDPLLLDAVQQLNPDLLLHKPIRMKELAEWVAGS